MRNFFGKHTDKDDKVDTSRFIEDGKLELLKEELDISKSKVQTGEVTLRKEIVEEHKTVDVPVTHEEVVIERRSFSNERSDSPIGEERTIRIPVSREEVEVGKHTVLTGEVSAYKHEKEEINEIEETLKREEARIEKTGDPNIIDENIDGNFH